MTSHLGLLLVFAAAVSIVFGVLMREDAAGQFRLGTRIFGSFVAGAIAAGWLMSFVVP